MKRSVTSLPLHYGKAPAWLFGRMKELSGAIASLVVTEFGPREFIRRMSDPVWFQALGCGAVKEGIGLLGDDFPVVVCGGKGRNSLRTPAELLGHGERWGIDMEGFVSMSRICAKIDNSLVQDGHDLYHHTFICSKEGDWAIIQQGMNGEDKTARRYQWFSREGLDVLAEPHTGVTCERTERILNLVARESAPVHEATMDFVKETPDRMSQTWKEIALSMPARHYIAPADVDQGRLTKIFRVIHESGAEDYRDLIQIRGVGPRTLAALTLVAEVVYDAPPSYRDPARFSFAHGGKDGHPFPVDRRTYDHSISFLKECLDRTRVNDRDKIDAFRRLARYESRMETDGPGKRRGVGA